MAMALSKLWLCNSLSSSSSVAIFPRQRSLPPPFSRLAATRKFERLVVKALESQEDVPPPGCSRIKVELKKPLGLRLEEDGNNIYVVEVLPDGNAAKSGLVEVGDQLIATSAVVYGDEEAYQGVVVRKGMQVVRLNVRGEKFDTVVAAIGTHPGYMKVVLELQKCKPTGENGGL